MDKATIKLRIYGRVQGVGYRAWTLRQAQKRGVSGWVRNRSDGTVEALLNGEESAVRAMIEACREGPLVARVDRIEEEAWAGYIEDGFVQKPTE